MSDLAKQIAEANARIAARRAAGVPMHGAFSLLGDPSNPLALVRCGIHCESCDLLVGGAFDLELEPSVRAAEEGLLLQLSARGCVHAQGIVAAERIESPDDAGSD